MNLLLKRSVDVWATNHLVTYIWAAHYMWILGCLTIMKCGSDREAFTLGGTLQVPGLTFLKTANV